MNNIESIVKKIADDAKLSAEQKIAEAQQEAQQIVSDYQAQADKIMQDAQAQAQKQASVIAERVESQSGLIRRNLMLQYKREAIEQAFQKSLEVLCAQDADKQVTLLSDAAVKYLSADAKVILNEKDKAAFELHSGRFLELLSDVDELLRTREEFNFDKWLSDARAWGQTAGEKDLLERDATALVTVWGADGDPLIFDYSWREWCGLIGNYYRARWEMFYDMLKTHLDEGSEYVEEGLKMTHGREAFRANDFYSRLGDWELEFVRKPHVLHHPLVSGDEVEVAGRMFRKYSRLAKEYYASEMEADQIRDGEIFENLGS